MLRTRLWMGAILILVALAVLAADAWLLPWAPGLLVLTLAAGTVACLETVRLMPAPRPLPWLSLMGVWAVMLANWGAPVTGVGPAWTWVSGTTIAFLMLCFLCEAAAFRVPGTAVPRLAATFFVVVYLGGFASWLLQLRWLPGHAGTFALLLAIFVPKMCDTGAYFTGRFLGKHRMSPILSPKKTWEGAAGGILAAMLTAVGVNALAGAFDVRCFAWPVALGFGATVGLAGMLGDLMESLIKRDSQLKDASDIMPGFGGVLDVLDSILFAAPVAYAWFAWGVATFR